MGKQIVVDRGEIRKISKDFKVTSKAMWEALVCRSNSSKARPTREVALERDSAEVGDQKEAVRKRRCYFSLEMSSRSIPL